MRRFVCLIAAIASLSLHAADAGPVKSKPLEFTRLDLTDGRTLTNVVIKSYDAGTDKLLAIVNGTATTIPVALLPVAVQAQFRTAPQSGSTVSIAPAQPPSVAPLKPGTTPPQANHPDSSRHDGQARRDDPQMRERAIATAHHNLALDYARRYFRYEYQVGPSNVRIDSVEFGDVTNREVPGWVGTYETSGTAYLEYYDSSHFSYGRAKVHFEVRTEQKPNEDIKVVSFDKRA